MPLPSESCVLDPYSLVLSKCSRSRTDERSARWHQDPLSKIINLIQRVHRRKRPESVSTASDSTDEQTNFTNEQPNKTATTRIRRVLASSLAMEERQTLFLAMQSKRLKSMPDTWLVDGTISLLFSLEHSNPSFLYNKNEHTCNHDKYKEKKATEFISAIFLYPVHLTFIRWKGVFAYHFHIGTQVFHDQLSTC